jgi:hypothetical protein
MGSSPSEPEELNDSGVLTGAAGIGLVLLAAATPIEPTWDRMLLLDFAAPAARNHTDLVPDSARESR